jgi:ABC-type uncharacterized transport system ATPase subunit
MLVADSDAASGSADAAEPVLRPALLQMRGICKAYGSVQANRDIDLDVRAGQIVGLLGENGSGKSTLMKVLFGMVRPDAGGIVFDGRELSAGSPRAALEAGIAMIHQHFMLVDAMSVTENVMLGQAQGGWRLDRGGTARAIVEAGRRYGLPVDPAATVESLALGERQRVEILKAILRGARLLILDEPTSILSPPEIEALLAFLERFRADGNAVVFITHKLREVLQVADEIVVLRDGAHAGRTSAAAATPESLARMMVGRETPPPIARTQAPRGPLRLRAAGLAACDANGTRRLEDASLELHAGEVLALAGIDGNGQAELCDVLAGLMPPLAGRIELDGADVTALGSEARVTAGIAYIPADRAATSLVQAMSIEDNLMLRDVRRAPFSRRGLLDRAAGQRLAVERFREFDVRAASSAAPARTLSGGNQQKVVLARELGRDPRVVIAFQPTWGLDPGSTRFVIERVLQLRNAGAAVLYLSSELDEVLAVGDRIGVISGGRIVEVVDRADVDLKRLGLALAGGSAWRSAA